MSCVTFIRHAFLPIESIRLGRFVRNLNEPQSDYLDPDCQPRREPITKPHLQYGELQQTAADKNLAALLTRLLSASWTKRRKEYTQVTTDQVTTYQLDNSGAWFKEAIKMQTTREWIKESIDQGDDIYIVVGYYTMFDAVVVEGSAESVGSSAKLEMPVTASLAAAGVVVPLDNVLDPGVAGSNINQRGIQRRFVASGEQVCAVQYRKVRFKWFSSRDLDKAFLERESRWKMYSNIRGQEIGTNDVVEVDLEDDLELDNDYEEHKSQTYGKFVL
jgi:hypothetical protein